MLPWEIFFINWPYLLGVSTQVWEGVKRVGLIEMDYSCSLGLSLEGGIYDIATGSFATCGPVP